jgi:hypothetical protein
VTTDAAATDAGAPAAPGRDGNAISNWLIGRGRLRWLTAMHSLHSAAETFFTVSMAGSIFFSVSPDAARTRVLVFLVITLAPFLVMAPLVGPVIDRIRGGIAGVVVSTFVVRIVLALLLAENLRTLFLFPLAFGVLVVAKTYTVGRNALVPVLAAADEDLVAANSRLSRTASLAGTVAGVAAVAMYNITSSGAWTLRTAAVLYFVGALVAWRLRKIVPVPEVASTVEIVELLRVDFTGAVWDMMALRAAVGYAVFHFAFSLRAGGEPAWLLGCVIAGNSAGGFLGTVISPALRRRMSERTMFTVSLLGSALAMVACGVAYSSATLIGAIFVLGLGASVGRRALDATIQQHAPHARRGREYASLETRLELAWVAAACLAVASRLNAWVGVLGLAGFLVVAAADHIRRHRLVDILEPPPSVPLPARLLTRAETLAGLDHHDEAIVVALSAIDMLPPDANLKDATKLDRIRQQIRASTDNTDQLRKAAEDVIHIARKRVSRSAQQTPPPAAAHGDKNGMV